MSRHTGEGGRGGGSAPLSPNDTLERGVLNRPKSVTYYLNGPLEMLFSFYLVNLALLWRAKNTILHGLQRLVRHSVKRWT
jgi:hypothetical protein